uniref:Uncharacterized protein n=1 Tax=Timema bartmani TaxID=61472 RepID=A0A7R9F5E7_9NEOP|nr:unnamed protein product [Timema bartmani]
MLNENKALLYFDQKLYSSLVLFFLRLLFLPSTVHLPLYLLFFIVISCYLCVLSFGSLHLSRQLRLICCSHHLGLHQNKNVRTRTTYEQVEYMGAKELKTDRDKTGIPPGMEEQSRPLVEIFQLLIILVVQEFRHMAQDGVDSLCFGKPLCAFLHILGGHSSLAQKYLIFKPLTSGKNFKD